MTIIQNPMKVLYDLKRNIMIFTVSLSQLYGKPHNDLLKSKRKMIQSKKRKP